MDQVSTVGRVPDTKELQTQGFLPRTIPKERVSTSNCNSSTGVSGNGAFQTIGYLHVNNLYPRNGHQLASHYLYSVRNPLTRLISWYIYNHPQSCDPREDNSPSCKKNAWKTSFYQCFPLLESLGWKNTSDNNPVFGGDLLRTNHCSKIFWDGWKGHVSQVKDPNHLYWNYNVSHLESGIYDR